MTDDRPLHRPSADRGGHRRLGLKDVAKAAGVSYQTVSRVINDDPRVSQATRQRVWKVIRQTGYVPNSAARALVTSQAKLLGIITDGSTRYGPAGILAGVENAGRDAGYSSSVVVLRGADEAATVVGYERLIDQGVEGIVVIAPRLPLAEAVRRTKFAVPVVMVAAGESSIDGISTVSEDQEYGARLATRYLIDMGHRQIAHVGGELTWLDGQLRVRGWNSEMEEAGIKPGTFVQGDWTGESGYRAGKLLLDQGLPTGVFVASDLMCLGVMRAFYEVGVRVPRDVSLVSFDDSDYAAQYFPPLSSVRQNFGRLGQEAVEMLLRRVAGEPAGTISIPPALVVRDSATRPRTWSVQHGSTER